MHDVFFFTDIHGHEPLFHAIMSYCIEQDNECTIIYGGDACDRGSSGYKIMQQLLDNPQVVYLKGNHEDMFVNAAYQIESIWRANADKLTSLQIKRFLHATAIYDDRCRDIGLSVSNGGYATLKDWMLDGMNMGFVDRIQHLPLTYSYGKIDICHAGGSYTAFQTISDIEYEQIRPIRQWEADEILWSRTSELTRWPQDRLCIHGHTPTPYLDKSIHKYNKNYTSTQPCQYTSGLNAQLSGMKIDMDVGTYDSNRAYVLNLLTLQAIGFQYNETTTQVAQCDVIQFLAP